jgi:hypothetical protein
MRNKERWHELCEQAAVEQDSEKLLTLVQTINQLLEEKRNRLLKRPPGATETKTDSDNKDIEVQQPDQ